MFHQFKVCFVLALTLILSFSTSAQTAQKSSAKIYFPSKGEWQNRRPEELGMDSAKLAEAVAYAQSQKGDITKNFSNQEEVFGTLLGPIPKERADSNGMIIRHGYVVAQWGNTKAVDPTYSVAKSVLSTIFGLALDRKMIASVQDPVKKYINDGGYASEHNAKITWEHHLQQTSEWEGAMWGKAHDFIGVQEFGKGRREPRTLHDPGTFWEYNDVRINRFALSLLRIWKRPLPEVLKTEIMDRIGASDTWQYQTYPKAEAEINGRKMKSVSGGTRWGGGLWINTEDEARFGYLFLRRGNWNGKQIISEDWVKRATAPLNIKPDYGYLWWLNTNRTLMPSASASSYGAFGAGSNKIWIDPENDLVIVWRWHDGNKADEFLQRVLAAVKAK